MSNEPLTHGGTILPETFKERIPEAGTIKIGEVVKNGDKMRPVKLDHFRYAGAQPTADGNYPDHPDFKEENKAGLRHIVVELISDDPEVNLEVNRVMGGRGFVTCKGNGKDAWRRMAENDARLTINDKQDFRKCPEGTCGDHCHFAKQRQCKLASTLRFRIPGHTPLGYVWKFRSTAWNTAQDMIGSMNAIKSLTGGKLARLPLHLKMMEQRRQPLVNGARQTTTFWSVGVAYMGTELDLLKDLQNIKEIEERYASLGLQADKVEATLKAIQASGAIMSDLDDREHEAAFAAEFLPSSEEGTPLDLLTSPGTPLPTPQAPPPPAAPKPAPAPKPAKAKKEEPANAPKQAPLLPDEEIPSEVLALEFKPAADAWSAFHASNTFEEMVEAAAACMGSFVYAGSQGGTLTEGAKKMTASQAGNAFRERLHAMLREMAGDQDTVLQEATTILTRYAESLKLVKPTAAPATPAAPAAPAKKVYPLSDAYKVMLGHMNTMKAQTEEEPLTKALAVMRDLHNMHGDQIGWKDHTGKRIQRAKDDNDPIYQTKKTNAINACRAANPKATRVETFQAILDALWKDYTADIKAWMAE